MPVLPQGPDPAGPVAGLSGAVHVCLDQLPLREPCGLRVRAARGFGERGKLGWGVEKHERRALAAEG